MQRRIVLFTILGLGCKAALSSNAWGVQKPKKPKNQNGGKDDNKDKDHEIQLDGVVEQVTPQGLLVKSEEARYLVGVRADSFVTIEGAAQKSFLANGAVVELEAELDRSGTVVGEVPRLTIIDPTPLDPIGIFPLSAAPAVGKGGEAAAGRYLIRGTVQSLRNGLIILNAGKRQITAHPAEGIELSGRFHDWRLATVGDTIKGKSELVPQPNTGVIAVVARKLTLRASEAITPLKSRGAKPGAPSNPETK